MEDSALGSSGEGEPGQRGQQVQSSRDRNDLGGSEGWQGGHWGWNGVSGAKCRQVGSQGPEREVQWEVVAWYESWLLLALWCLLRACPVDEGAFSKHLLCAWFS